MSTMLECSTRALLFSSQRCHRLSNTLSARLLERTATSAAKVLVTSGTNYCFDHFLSLNRDLVLHHVPRNVVDHDISVFFKQKFGEIRDEFEDLPSDWPGDAAILAL